jgi:hypothetical protein
VVTVTRIDRLARSTFDLFAIVKQIVDAKAQFRSLAEPWADTGTSTGRLMIAVLGGLAGVRPNPHSHRRGPQPGAEATAAHGPTFETRRRAAGRGPTATHATLAELARSYQVGKNDFEASLNAIPTTSFV